MYIVEYLGAWWNRGWQTAWTGTDVREAEKVYTRVAIHCGLDAARMLHLLRGNAGYQPTPDGERYAQEEQE